MFINVQYHGAGQESGSAAVGLAQTTLAECGQPQGVRLPAVVFC